MYTKNFQKETDKRIYQSHWDAVKLLFEQKSNGNFSLLVYGKFILIELFPFVPKHLHIIFLQKSSSLFQNIKCFFFVPLWRNFTLSE